MNLSGVEVIDTPCSVNSNEKTVCSCLSPATRLGNREPACALAAARNIVKHEGGDPEIDAAHEHPSDILDYFREKAEVIASGDWERM